MNNKKIYRPVIAATLSVIMVTGSVMPVFAADDTKKEENVYVNLQNDGSVDGVYVVNKKGSKDHRLRRLFFCKKFVFRSFFERKWR